MKIILKKIKELNMESYKSYFEIIKETLDEALCL